VCPQPIKKLSSSYESWRFVSCSQDLATVPYYKPDEFGPLHYFLSCKSLSNIVLLFMLWLHKYLFPLNLRNKFLLLPYMCDTCLSYLALLNFFTHFCWRVYIVNFLIKQFVIPCSFLYVELTHRNRYLDLKHTLSVFSFFFGKIFQIWYKCKSSEVILHILFI
jgi:hypothetical protein